MITIRLNIYVCYITTVLQRDGFGKHPYFCCVVAETSGQNEEEKEIIGYVFFYYTYSTWEGRAMYMEDIYVKPEYRSKGVGTALLKHIAKIGVESGCARLDFAVFDWNNSAISFYKNRGAENISETEGWNHFRIRRRELEKLSYES
ncbi:diamine acetyltransferase 2-like [Centruroides sculpturatus]|uniref:diamine acetyltransferase 2-like n=1 Tax=Centruroides sculpturatus TaxID=218467 RepID=UPI000C6D0C95|nr:diamine acetyltransferase 2-like [Centruroides sculpturatus]